MKDKDIIIVGFVFCFLVLFAVVRCETDPRFGLFAEAKAEIKCDFESYEGYLVGFNKYKKMVEVGHQPYSINQTIVNKMICLDKK